MLLYTMDEKKKDKKYNTAVQAIFKDGSSDLEFYQGLMADVASGDYKLPQKTRENFLFLPYEILKIFPTILSFSSRNLYFGENFSTNQSNLKRTSHGYSKKWKKGGEFSCFR